ncbi:MAG: glycerophosphodiester phosphodiesterase family protein, partial [Actinomycetes bacterium]
ATHRGLAALAPRGVPCAQVPDRVGRLRVVTAGLVRLAHERGQRVHAWTVDDAADMHRLLDLGVDGIMTDRIETLRDVLLARGSWPA